MSEVAQAVEQLLITARRAAARGELARARAVVRAMSLQYPRERSIWELLADLAETDAERQLAIEQLAALTPWAVPEAMSVPAFPAAVELAPEPIGRATPIRWPVLVVVAVAGVALLLLALWRWGGPPPSQGTAAPTLSVSASPAATVATLIPTQPAGEGGAPTAQPLPQATSAATALVPAPTSTPRPALQPGAIVESGTWAVTLLRPQDLVLLDGSIGGVQPSGRFALALLAIHHGGASAARIPTDLIALVDSDGQRYLPLSGASTTYLNTYGRGTYGDLSLEEPIIPEIGQVSVPIVFDVPLDARGLQLVVADNPAGWLIQP